MGEGGNNLFWKTDNVIYGQPQLAEQFCLYFIISLQVYKYLDYFAKNK